jgi:NifU-like protein involved in Fe-S cluster formation
VAAACAVSSTVRTPHLQVSRSTLAGAHAPNRQAPFSSLPLNPYIVANSRPAINGFLGYATVIWAVRMLNDVYNRRILELAGTIPRIGRLDRPDASATAHSKLCGSTVSVDLRMEGDTVSDFAHEVKACALGQASSSIMARNVVGAKAGELRSLRDAVRRMLKENGAPPAAGKWADIAVLEPVRDYKARHASTMLTFDAVVDAINQIEAKRAGAAPDIQPAK